MKKLNWVIVAIILLVSFLFVLTGCQNQSSVNRISKESEAAKDVVKNENATEESEIENQLLNGDFSAGTEGWGVYMEQNGDSSLSEKDGVGNLSINNTGKVDYSVQLYYDGFELYEGGVYKLTVDLGSTVPRLGTIRIQLNGGDYHAYVEMQVVAQDNLFGYLTDGIKKAILRGENLGENFQILNEQGEVVFEGELKGPVNNETADEVNYYADFTEFSEIGTYTMVSGEAEESYPFTIGEGIYEDVLKASIKMLYLQRSGIELEEEYAGDFARAAGHLQDATIYGTTEKKEVTGGWYDAGDYGRYVSPGAITVADLFLAYEDFTDLFEAEGGDAYGIPESGNGVPDILDEARYELEWMLKMQDDATGGVYHKVTCKTFPGFVAPDEETDELFLSPISTTATGAFAAIMAKSSVVYKEIDAEFSMTCLNASKVAWSYLEENENIGGFTNPSDIVTGEYGDAEDADERYWAAAELLNATGEQVYAEYIEVLIEQNMYRGFGWADVGTYASITCIRLDANLLTKETRDVIKDAVVEEADRLLALSKTDGYGISLGNDYMWGSNMAVCNYARQMILASEISESEEYQAAIADHLHYILGANPMSICYVTGFGTVSAQEPHHRISSVIGSPMPGMVIGGPDSALQDPAAEQMLKDVPPAKCYIDNEQSYSTNEITIYWNSPFVYLLGKIMSE